MKRVLGMILVGLIAITMVCGAMAEGTEFVKAEDIQALTNKTLRLLPTDTISEEPIKIAAIGWMTGEWGMTVVRGQEFAASVLAGRNCTVDVITHEDLDTMKWSDTVESCIASGYKAVCLIGINADLEMCVEDAKVAGIPVFYYAGDVDDSAREAFFGLDDFSAGVEMGKAIAEMLPDGGKYAIITGSFTAYGHEQRRKGVRSVLDETGIFECIGEYENNDDPSLAYSFATDIMTANPDVATIVHLCGGPSGTAQAIIDAGREDDIVMTCFDCTSETAGLVKDGVISVCLDQDAFNEGYVPVIAAYNLVVDGIKSESINYFTPTKVDASNVEQLFPECL